MTNVTLDMNCIIDLEEARESAPCIQRLMSLHQQGKINLRVVAIGASERKPDGTYATNFAEFKDKIGAVGLGQVEILLPLCYWDISFWDWCLNGDDQLADVERKIHEVLFPQIEFLYSEFCSKRGLDTNSGEIDRRWRNAKCDVLALWSHIYHGGGIFVTRDTNFLLETKRSRLIALGSGDILSPQIAVARLSGSGNG